MTWTEERVVRLRELWADGLTASQIAKALGSVSRNAVIGKVHRLGLSNRTTGVKPCEADGEEPIELTKKETIVPPAPVREAIEPKITAPAEAPSVVAPAQAASPAAMLQAAAATAQEPNPIAVLAAEAERNARKLSLLELNERTCKWPIGDPSTADFYFCGLQATADKPYCSAHNSVAYQPMSSRRDRDRSRTPTPPRAISA